MNELYEGLLEELECKICTSYMAPPIRQCETGHSLCAKCMSKLPHCPLCQGKFTDSRNISLEALARRMQFPCSNARSGCREKLVLEEREQHERNCGFKVYKCAYFKCPWTGSYNGIFQHWMQKKQASKPYGEQNICHTKMSPQGFYINLVHTNGHLFWYKFKQTNGKLLWVVQFLGAPEQAKDYYFEIEIIKPGEPLRRYLISEYCQSEEIDVETLFKQPGGCAQTTAEAVSHFVGSDQLLIYYLRIKPAKGDNLRLVDIADDASSVGIEPARERKNFNRGGNHPQMKFYKNKRDNVSGPRNTVGK